MLSLQSVSLGIMAGLFGILPGAVAGNADTGWLATFHTELPAFGHRNWIVVADAAYPKQVAPGIETVYTGGEMLDVLNVVLKEIENAPHVRPVILLDAELQDVSEQDSPGADAYRADLNTMLDGAPFEYVPHEEIMAELDAAGKLFNILLLKTDLTIPYTSVFIKLDCGYWSGEQEKRLREAIEKKK